jgi:lipopolysaccharide export system protein LptA
MAEKAVYYEDDEKVVLTGKPVVKQGNDFVEGSKITLYLKEKRSLVEGSKDQKVRAVLFPRREKR